MCSGTNALWITREDYLYSYCSLKTQLHKSQAKINPSTGKWINNVQSHIYLHLFVQCIYLYNEVLNNKKNDRLLHAIWMNLKIIFWIKDARWREAHTILFHLYKHLDSGNYWQKADQWSPRRVVDWEDRRVELQKDMRSFWESLIRSLSWSWWWVSECIQKVIYNGRKNNIFITLLNNCH